MVHSLIEPVAFATKGSTSPIMNAYIFVFGKATRLLTGESMPDIVNEVASWTVAYVEVGCHRAIARGLVKRMPHYDFHVRPNSISQRSCA